MPIRFELSREEIEGSDIFDIGQISDVYRSPTTDSVNASYLESDPSPVFEYKVDLLTKIGTIDRVLSLGGRDRQVYRLGDRVLLFYPSYGKQPIILSEITDKDWTKRKRLEYPHLEEGERFISTEFGNAVYFRNDGALVLNGAWVERDKENLTKEIIHQSYNLILGGKQGITPEDKKVLISISVSQLGMLIFVDEDGELHLVAPKITQSSDTLKSVAGTNEEKIVGYRDMDEKNLRYGTYSKDVGDASSEVIGESRSMAVGKYDSANPDDIEKTFGVETKSVGKDFNLFVGKNVTIHTSQDGTIDIKRDTGEEVFIEKEKITITSLENGQIFLVPDGIRIGTEDAAQPIPLGYKLLNWLSTHKHVAPNGPTSPPIEPPLPINLLSQKHKVKD
jgi:hypothetical protein